MVLERLLGADSTELRPMLETWRALAPVRGKLKDIDWRKLQEIVEKILPVLLVILDLLPKKPA